MCKLFRGGKKANNTGKLEQRKQQMYSKNDQIKIYLCIIRIAWQFQAKYNFPD